MSHKVIIYESDDNDETSSYDPQNDSEDCLLQSAESSCLHFKCHDENQGTLPSIEEEHKNHGHHFNFNIFHGHHNHPPATAMYKKMERHRDKSKDASKPYNVTYFQIYATWMTDTRKSVLVDIDSNETIEYLLRKIGERMEETHQEFRGLRHCHATEICLANGDHLKDGNIYQRLTGFDTAHQHTNNHSYKTSVKTE